MKILNIFIVLLPWKLRRLVLIKFYNYHIDPSSRIGFSYIFPAYLKLDAKAEIGSMNVAIHLDRLVCGKNSFIGRGNWITGHPASGNHFKSNKGRDSSLTIGDHSAITKSHIIDCTDKITIGKFSTLAGYKSQLITHGINIETNRQECAPIFIGNHCLIGSSVIILGGSFLPNKCILGAGSLLNKRMTKDHSLYGGIPATHIKTISEDSQYFHRDIGFVD